MKNIIKKTLATLMSLTLILSAFSIGVNVASAATSGDCTSTITWSYDTSTKTLTLTGTGAMPDYRATNIGSNRKSPWESEKIGDNTIKSVMEHLVVGEGITEIGEYNFFNCVSLKSVQLPSTLKSIDGMGAGTDLASASYGAFQNCESLTEIALPPGLETIEPYAFKNCKSLKSISLPNSLKTLGKCAFLLCESLETVTFPTGQLTETGENTFNSCGVKRINWGSITDVSNQSFYSCNIKDVEFPEQVKSIGSRAFANNTPLMNVKINNASMEFKGTNTKTSNNFSGSNQTVTIIGHSASTAQKFASDYEYRFVSIDDCDHTNTRTEIIEEATCTEAGLQHIICNDCEFLVNESEIPALGHDYQLMAENDSTDLDGHIYKSYKCKRCGHENETVEHSMQKNSIYHVWKDGYYEESYIVEPTCTTAGIVTYTCTVDGCVNALGRPTSDRMTVESGHKVDDDNWRVTTAATCTKAGSRVGICSECGETVTETIPATGHTYEDGELIDTEDNEENGHKYYYFKCKTCGQLVEEKEHIKWVSGCYVRKEVTKATCTVPGLARDTCRICGETRTHTIPATGEHDYKETDRKEPTCTTRGTITYTCKNCEQTKNEYVPAKGHEYILDEEASKTPTCTESGKNVYLCSVCSATKTDTVPATGHTPASGTYSVVTQPTCTKTGLAVATCAVCSTAYEQTLEALGHDFENAETDLTSEGKPGHVLSVPTCKRCGVTETGKVVHKDWIEGYYTTSGTSVETCESTYTVDTCTICNERRSVENPGVGHEFIFVNQTYEGITLICRHCATRILVNPQTLLDYWNEVSPVNSAPNRTETDNSGYLDMDGNRILNAKDYARIVNACKKAPKLIEEHEQKIIDDYNREYASGGAITAGKTGTTVDIKDNDGTITPGYEYTFTPTKSGTYTFYSLGTVDISSISDFDLSALEGLDTSSIDPSAIDTSELGDIDAEAALIDTIAYLSVDGADDWLAYDDNGGTLRHFRFSYECVQGVTYRIRTGLSDTSATGTYKLYVVREGADGENYTRNFVDGGEISESNYLGKEVRINDENCYDFTFTASKTGKYRFYSVSTKETFAYFEPEGAETWAEYSEGGTLNAFSIEYECEAGKTYHLKTGLMNENETGTYRVLIVAPVEINT